MHHHLDLFGLSGQRTSAEPKNHQKAATAGMSATGTPVHVAGSLRAAMEQGKVTSKCARPP